MGHLVIETRGLTKAFAGFTAVQDVDLRVRRGSIHALIGPNGAGKTTVFNLLTKFLPPSRARASTTAASSMVANKAGLHDTNPLERGWLPSKPRPA